MSQICYDQISLGELVNMSSEILRVRKARPETRHLEIPMEGKDFETGEPIGPFRKVIFRFTVEEVLLHSYGPVLASGDEIEVARANWRQDFDMQRRYCLEGLSESPIYRAYNAPEEPEGDELLVFLQWEEKEWCFACDGAQENPARRKEIKKLIKRNPNRGVVYPIAEDDTPPPAAPPRRSWWARLFGK